MIETVAEVRFRAAALLKANLDKAAQGDRQAAVTVSRLGIVLARLTRDSAPAVDMSEGIPATLREHRER